MVERGKKAQPFTVVDPEGQRDPAEPSLNPEAMEDNGTFSLLLTPCGKKDYIKNS